MRYRIPLLLLTLACSGAVRADEPADRPIEGAWDAIDAWVERQMEKWDTPGLALAITSADRSLREAYYGYRDRKARLPVTGATLFEIGSISKSFTAIALLQQAEAGRLDLDAPVVDYLTWFDVGSRHAPIAAHHLLTHTAGIPANRDDLPSSAYMAYALREQITAWPPGERYLYSNIGYQVLHQLLEHVARRSYAELIRERIFEPLGMRDSAPVINQSIRDRLAVGYIAPYDDRPWHRSHGVVEAPFFEYGIGDGSIAATVPDMARYARMLLAAGRGPQGRLIGERSFERFSTSWTTDEEGDGYGYGIGIVDADGRRLLAHSGGMVGYLSQLIADPAAGIAVVVLHNGVGGHGEVARYALAATRAALAGEPLPEAPALPDPTRLERAGDYAGEFRTVDGRKLGFEADGDRLVLVDGPRRERLEQAGAELFHAPGGAFGRYYLQFHRDTDGRIVELTHGPDWYFAAGYRGPRRFETPAGWRALLGTYVSPSPWFPRFTVVVRKDGLWALLGAGGESSAGELRLWPVADGEFSAGDPPTPERVRFDSIVDGRALRANWSGHPFYRLSRSLD